MITKEQIIEAILQAGIHRGDVIALNSSLSSMGQVNGGAKTVVEAFVEVVGDRGTLLVPTFTYSLKQWSNFPPFNPVMTPSLCGEITEAVRLWPGAVRSYHPTHSTATLGFFARELAKDHHKCTPLGKGTPYHKLSQMGGLVVLLGVGMNRNPLIHTCEVLAKLPYLSIPWSNNKTGIDIARQYDDNGKIVEIEISEVPGCSEGFVKLESVLQKRGIVQIAPIGNTVMQVMKAENVVDIVLHILKEDPLFLLCKNPECGICPRRRKFAKSLLNPKKSGLSDKV